MCNGVGQIRPLTALARPVVRETGAGRANLPVKVRRRCTGLWGTVPPDASRGGGVLAALGSGAVLAWRCPLGRVGTGGEIP